MPVISSAEAPTSVSDEKARLLSGLVSGGSASFATGDCGAVSRTNLLSVISRSSFVPSLSISISRVVNSLSGLTESGILKLACVLNALLP
ncbi:MAG: hypothetical protein HY811_09800 [Planctomycetes bacterium]|nr:hypothetical protein [Planctomycetota bacterium]